MADFEVTGAATADVGRFIREMDRMIDSMDRAQRQAEELDRALDRLGNKTPSVRVEITGEEKIRELEERLDRLTARTHEVRVRVNVDGAARALAQLEAVNREIERLRDANIRLGGAFNSANRAAGGGGGGGGLIKTLLALSPLIAAAGNGLTGLAYGLAGSFATAGIGVGAFALFAMPTFKGIIKAAGETDAQIAKLPPDVQRAVASFKDFKDHFVDLQNKLQPTVMKVFAEGLNAARAGMDGLFKAAKPAGDAIAGLLKKAAEGFQGREWQSFFKYLHDNVGEFITKWGTAIGNFVTGIANMIRAFNPLSHLVTDGFLGMSKSFRQWSDGLTKNAGFQSFVKSIQTYGPPLMKALGSILGTILSFVNLLGQAFMPVLTTLVQALAPLVKALADALLPALRVLAPPLQVLIKALGGLLMPIIKALGPVLQTFAKVIGAILLAISPLLPVIGNLVAALLPALQPILQALVTVFQQLAPFVQAVGMALLKLLTPVLQALPSILGPIMNIFTTLTGALLPVLTNLVIQITPSLGEFGKAFSEIFRALGPLIDAIMKLAGDLGKALAPILPPLIGVVSKLAGVLVGELSKQIMTIVVPALTAITDFLNGNFSGAWANSKKTVKGVGEYIVDIMIKLPGEVFSALGQLATLVGKRAWQAQDQLTTKIHNGVITALNYLSGLPGKAASALSGLGGRLFNSGASLIQGFIEGILSKLGPVRNAAATILGAVAGFFPHSPAKEGPFSGRGWTLYSGHAVAEAMADGMLKRVEAVRAAAMSLTTAMAGSLGGGGSMSVSLQPKLAGQLSAAMGGGSNVTFAEGAVKIYNPTPEPASASLDKGLTRIRNFGLVGG